MDTIIASTQRVGAQLERELRFSGGSLQDLNPVSTEEGGRTDDVQPQGEANWRQYMALEKPEFNLAFLALRRPTFEAIASN